MNYAPIIAKLKTADGGRFSDGIADLNADVYEALGYEVIRRRRHPGGVCWRYRGHGLLREQTHWCSMESFTSDTDAALGLVNKLVGKGVLDITISYETASPQVYPAVTLRWYPLGVPRDGKSYHCAVEGAATIPLALLAAMFEALGRLNPEPRS